MSKQPPQKNPRTVISIADLRPAVAPNVAAALLLSARALGAALDLPMPATSAILEATGAGKSSAYELASKLKSLLTSLAGPSGRPRSTLEPPPFESVRALHHEVLEYVYAHPGVVHGTTDRRRYADSFRHFVVDLRHRYVEIALPAFADAIGIPLGTAQEWLHRGVPRDDPNEPSESRPLDTTVLQVQTLLSAWAAWKGPFTAFCEHARREHALRFGNTAIASLLELHGARTPKRRTGRTPDEEALRGLFRTIFADAQWVGDGTGLQMLIDGEAVTVNIELNVDAFSDAFVGIDVTAEEDSAAVVGAFAQGIATTTRQPIALLLDNKPCNHTADVDAALGDTMRIRATTFRAQNKAHVEGAFGLFKAELPPIELDTSNSMRLAIYIARLVAETFARGINLRPRQGRGGTSRKDLHRAGKPISREQRAAAEQALRARLRKQEHARQTCEARQDPLVRELLNRAFEHLGLDDPERHFRNAIARYPRDTIIDSLAIYAGKAKGGTLPPSVDARYLLGIVKNVHHVHEADAIIDATIDLRLAARDALLAPLVRRRDETSGEANARLYAFIDEAMATERDVERRFWIHTAADLIATQLADDHSDLYRSAARRIHNTFKVRPEERDLAARRLARRLWPVV